MEFNTRLLHGKAVERYGEGATLPPVAQVNAFRYDSAEELDQVFHHRKMGYCYSRVANPTVTAFERRVNEMEGGAGAVACSSGMTAIVAALLNFLCSGDEIIASAGLYGGTFDLFRDLEGLGIVTRYVRHMVPEEIEPLIGEHTRAIFGEVISNPGLEIMDIRACADLAHEKKIPLIVDATTATPYLTTPIACGADIVIHSTTKYINGSGDAIGGIVIDSGRFPWDAERFKGLAGFKAFGKGAFMARLRTDTAENMGGCMAPQTAFLNVIGLETLGLRMKQICQNTYELAAALNRIQGLKVNYPLLEGNPCRELALRQLNGMGGGILTFRAGSRQKAFRIIDGLHYAVKASSIGDVRTLVIHPASTLYIHSDKERMEAAGVYEDTVRVSVGIEDVVDLIGDFTDVINKNI